MIPKERIFLIGFMGCGKSYTGQRLADLLDYRFLDLDDHIEARAGMDISTIFAREGEDGFRQRERQALHDMAQIDRVVVACGGGAPCFFDNMAWMNQHGLTIYLEATPQLLAERLHPGREHRPLLAALSDSELLSFIEQKLQKRQTYYQQAHLIFSQQEPFADIAPAVKKQLDQMN